MLIEVADVETPGFSSILGSVTTAAAASSPRGGHPGAFGFSEPTIFEIHAAFVKNSGSHSSMRCMSITPRPGMKAKVHHVTSYGLPNGLEEGDELTVIDFSNGYCGVRDAQGREFRLFMGCVDCGTLYEINHRWLPPHHPSVIQERQRYESLMSAMFLAYVQHFHLTNANR